MKVFNIDTATEVRREGEAAFSLLELLTVMAIMSILAAAVIPALSAVQSAGNFSQSTSTMSSILEQARAYAMGNNTYVYVGLQEVDGNTRASGGTGCVVVVVVASQDGTRPYANAPGVIASDVVAVSKPLLLGNTHLVSSASLSAVGNMQRPSGATDVSSATTTTTFQWPLAGSAKYSFSKVIEFDPQGTARLQTASTYDSSIPAYIEIPMVPTHGNTIVAVPGNQAALQIQGVTGAVRAYRP